MLTTEKLVATPAGSERRQDINNIEWLTAKSASRISAPCENMLANLLAANNG